MWLWHKYKLGTYEHLNHCSASICCCPLSFCFFAHHIIFNICIDLFALSSYSANKFFFKLFSFYQKILMSNENFENSSMDPMDLMAWILKDKANIFKQFPCSLLSITLKSTQIYVIKYKCSAYYVNFIIVCLFIIVVYVRKSVFCHEYVLLCILFYIDMYAFRSNWIYSSFWI